MKKCLFINFNDDFLIDFVHKVFKSEKMELHSIYTDVNKISDYMLETITYVDIFNFYDINSLMDINKNSSIALSKQNIEDFYFLEAEYLSETDRLSYLPMNIKKRKMFYYETLLYWIDFFKNNLDIDIVVFDGVPHMGWDLVCYEVAKKFNIHTYYFELTIIQDQVFWHDDYRSFKNEKVKKSNYSITELKDILGEENLKKFNVESELLLLGKKLNDELNNKKKLELNFSKTLKTFYKTLYSFKVKNDSSLFYSPLNQFEYIYYQFSNIYYLNNLRKEYYKLSKKVDVSEKYIFFAMHYQPERTTSPQGECFQEQILAIKIIAKSLPKGWKLFVKEHPTQLLNRKVFKNRNFRDINDYHEILKLSNTELVSIDMDSADLIKNAQLTATINGSIGWETLNTYKKPIAIFGNIWYGKCNSCFNISSQEDLIIALSQLNLYTEEIVEKDILDLLNYYKDKFITSSDGHYYAAHSPFSRDTLVNNLASSFLKLLR